MDASRTGLHVVCLPKLQLLVSMLLAFASISNRPFPNCSKPLFQSEAKCEAVDTKWFCILLQIKLIITKPRLVRVLELEIDQML